MLVRHLYAKIANTKSLRVAVQEAWSHVDEETRKKLMESMPNRTFEFTPCKGGATYY